MPAPYLGSPREVDVDMWTSLPTDILLEIFLCLEPTTVVRCACVCKPWRRAITSNAASLRRRRPHLDRFDPSLLLGIFHMNRHQTWLRRTPDPSPFQSALPSNGSGHYETVDSFIPAASAFAAGAIRGFYTELLCSRDGFILLKARTAEAIYHQLVPDTPLHTERDLAAVPLPKWISHWHLLPCYIPSQPAKSPHWWLLSSPTQPSPTKAPPGKVPHATSLLTARSRRGPCRSS